MHALGRVDCIAKVRTTQPVRPLRIGKRQEARFMRRAIGPQHDIAPRLPPFRVEQKAARGVIEREEIPAHFFERLAGSKPLGRAFECAQIGSEAARGAALVCFRLIAITFG